VAQECGTCSLLKGLVLAYELAVAEEPMYAVMAVERFREKRSERPHAAMRDGVVEDLERFVTNTRPASEGSYLDAVATWRLYEAYCLDAGREGEPFCRRLWDTLVSRTRRALVVWGGAWNIGASTAAKLLRDVARLHRGEIDLLEYLRRNRSHIVSAFRVLHITRPEEYPLFNDAVCGLVCRAEGGKRCSCSRMSHREWHKLYTDYVERVVESLRGECGETLSDLEARTGKSLGKLLAEALWLIAGAKERTEHDEEFKKAYTEAMQYMGCPVDPEEGLRRVEEKLRRLLSPQ